MNRRSGFTLMELLLVVAILAIIAAVAAPQFFRSSDIAMTDARIMLLKSNYSAIKAAVNMCVWDDMNNKNVVAADKLATSFVAGTLRTGSGLKILVKRGFLQENQCYFENAQGQKLLFGLSLNGTTPANPYTGTNAVASAPVFMENTNLYGVTLNTGANTAITLTGTANNFVEEALQIGTGDWLAIWNLVKASAGLD